MSKYDLNKNNDFDPFYMKSIDVYFTHFYSIAETENGDVFKVIFDAMSDDFNLGGLGITDEQVIATVKNSDILEYSIEVDTVLNIKMMKFKVSKVIYDEFGTSKLILAGNSDVVIDRFTGVEEL